MKELGLAFGSVFEDSQALYAILQWRFRTQKIIQSNSFLNNYCKTKFQHLRIERELKGDSQVWKYILENKYKIEQVLWWEPTSGTSSIWYENLTNLGPLFNHQINLYTCHIMKYNEECIIWQGWNFDVKENFDPEYVVTHIRSNLSLLKLLTKGIKLGILLK